MSYRIQQTPPRHQPRIHTLTLIFRAMTSSYQRIAMMTILFLAVAVSIQLPGAAAEHCAENCYPDCGDPAEPCNQPDCPHLMEPNPNDPFDTSHAWHNTGEGLTCAAVSAEYQLCVWKTLVFYQKVGCGCGSQNCDDPVLPIQCDAGPVGDMIDCIWSTAAGGSPPCGKPSALVEFIMCWKDKIPPLTPPRV